MLFFDRVNGGEPLHDDDVGGDENDEGEKGLDEGHEPEVIEGVELAFLKIKMLNSYIKQGFRKFREQCLDTKHDCRVETSPLIFVSRLTITHGFGATARLRKKSGQSGYSSTVRAQRGGDRSRMQIIKQQTTLMGRPRVENKQKFFLKFTKPPLFKFIFVHFESFETNCFCFLQNFAVYFRVYSILKTKANIYFLCYY